MTLLRWAAGAVLAFGVLLPAVPAPAQPAPPTTPLAVRSMDGEELAGSLAGQGRAHPGRPLDLSDALPELLPQGPAKEPHTPPRRPAEVDSGLRPHSEAGLDPDGQPQGTLEAEPEPTPPGPPVPAKAEPQNPPPGSYDPRGATSRATALGVNVLPLGAGLALMGLGLGSLALRLRRL
ncbi:hypothetical protein [Streptomyces sp. NPDC006879]|uniref:hypothetical protein n=1 Tax=Streptomyces sp. NPDC006879 TaxID=3364767 RepID=UPI0036A5389F